MNYRIPQYEQERMWREEERQEKYEFKRQELEDEYIPSNEELTERERYLEALEIQQERRNMIKNDRW